MFPYLKPSKIQIWNFNTQLLRCYFKSAIWIHMILSTYLLTTSMDEMWSPIALIADNSGANNFSKVTIAKIWTFSSFTAGQESAPLHITSQESHTSCTPFQSDIVNSNNLWSHIQHRMNFLDFLVVCEPKTSTLWPQKSRQVRALQSSAHRVASLNLKRSL